MDGRGGGATPPGVRRAGPVVQFAREYWFALPPAALWDVLQHFERYPSWWAWLREFRATPQDSGLVAGTVLHGTVVPPLPGRLSVRVTLERCEPATSIEASVDGDVRGAAALHLTAANGGTTVAARWTLELVNPPLRVAARLGFPLARRAHDCVISRAVSGFRRNALPTAGR